jgi:hypothetical protein
VDHLVVAATSAAHVIVTSDLLDVETVWTGALKLQWTASTTMECFYVVEFALAHHVEEESGRPAVPGQASRNITHRTPPYREADLIESGSHRRPRQGAARSEAALPN